MIEWKQMTMQEAENKMEVLREIFDVVRLLKGSDLQAAGMESKLAGRENLCQCYAFWNKDKRCENCISLILICIRYLQGMCRLTVSLM